MAKLHRDNAGYIGCSHEETQDPYYSYNKLSLPLSGATETVQRPAEVTHTVTVAGGKFVIGGVSQATLSLVEGGTYKFDQSDSSNSNHPFRFSQTSNGTWNRGTEYTKGVSYVGTPGSSGAYTQLVVPFGGLDLYYYCGNHTGMGGSATTPANAGMFTAALPILKTTDQFGATLGSGVNADPFASNLVLAVPMNGANNSNSFTDISPSIRGTGSAKAITKVSDPYVSTADYALYGSSGVFDGDDYLSLPDGPDFDFGYEDFTIECWLKHSGATNNNGSLFATKINALATTDFNSRLYATGQLDVYTSGSSEYISISGVPVDSWIHVAFSRKGNTMRVFVNGEVKATNQFWGLNLSGDGFLINKGRDSSGNRHFQDVRVYKGVAKYHPEGSGSLGMDVVTYKGNSTSQVINTLAFEPDFIWCKTLTNAVDHKLTDSVRGFTKVLESNQNRAEATDTNGITGTSTGFNVGSSNDFNNGSRSYIAWCWKAGGAATTIATNSLTNTAYERSQNWTNLMTFNAGTWNGNGINPFNLDGSDHDYGNVTRSNGGYATLDISSLTGSRVISVTSQQTEVTITHDGGTTTFTPPHTSQITHTFDAVTNPTSIKFIGLNSGSYFVLVGVSVDGKRLINSNISAPTVPSIASTVSANADYGFSIVKYNSGTTTGNYTLAHSLSSVPKFIIHKQLSTGNWWVYHESVINDLKKYLQLNSTGSVQTNSGAFWGNAFPDSSTFGIGVGDLIGTSTDAVAYCWSEIPGFSKISSYSGTGLGGNKVTTGFKPKFVLIKASSSGTSAGWGLYQEGVTDRQLMANCSGEEGVRGDCATGSSLRDIQSNVTFNEDGFTLSSGWYEQNNSGTTYIYAAFAESAPGDPGQDAFKILETLNTKDQSSSAHTVTNNGASFQTSVSKYYNGAARFLANSLASSGNKVTIDGSNGDFAFGTGDFTVEFWYQADPTEPNISYNALIGNIAGSASGYWRIGSNYGGTNTLWFTYTTGSYSDVNSSVAIMDNAWHHIAATREGSTLRLFLDGSVVKSDSSVTSDFNQTTDLNIMYSAQQPGYASGYMQDVRIYKGIAKYTSSFSPPERSIQGTARRYPSGVYVVS